MSSILTNATAMSALQNLSNTQKDLAKTQAQISSGLKVANAADNAAYWSIATTMKSDTSALSAVSDALNLGSSVVGTANAAVTSTLGILNKLKADLVTAQTPGTDATQIQTDISAQQKALIGISSSASFNGVNLLDGSSGASVSIVSSFARNGSGTSATTTLGTISITTAGFATGGTQLTGSAGALGSAITNLSTNAGTAGTAGAGVAPSTIFAKTSVLGFDITKIDNTSTTTTAADYAALTAGIDAAIKSVTAIGAALGSTQTNITAQSSFVTSLNDSLTSGVGSLVDADMNVASTRLQALQTQQQLGIQALSMANQNSQLILKLFQ